MNSKVLVMTTDNILVLGNYGYANNDLSGQTVKTRAIFSHLAKLYGDQSVKSFDTQTFQQSKLNIFRMFKLLALCDRVAYLPAHGNFKYLFPIIFILSKICSFKVDYFVVGGWLCDYLKNKPLHRWFLRAISGIYPETDKLKKQLENEYGFKNVCKFTNFREFDIKPIIKNNKKLELVFMARIHLIKGLDWIFYLAEYLKNNNLTEAINITFFGPINPDAEEYFKNNLEKYRFIKYHGALKPERIYDELIKYDVLLFPTHYIGEGLPGTIVDAYIAGLPVIASDWPYAREFVEDGKSGFIIPFKDGEDDLIAKVLQLKEDPILLKQMQDYALKKRMEFAPPSKVFRD